MRVCNTCNMYVSQGMRVLLDARDKLGISWQSSENEKHAMLLMSSWEGCHGTGGVEPGDFQLYVSALSALWRDGGVQQAYARRSEYQLVRKHSHTYTHTHTHTHIHTDRKSVV